jgi:hypothetical protein
VLKTTFIFLVPAMPYTCEFCGKELKSSNELIRHLREEHKNKVKLRKLEHPKTEVRAL